MPYTLSNKNYFSFTIDDFIFGSKFKTFENFQPKFVEGRDGAALREKVDVKSGLGPKPGN